MDPQRPANTARLLFLNPRAHEFFLDWDKVAIDSIGNLRAPLGVTPTTGASRS